MIDVVKKYNVTKILNLLMSMVFVSLFFTPTINELYDVYAYNHSLHCTAKNENHLHKEHETFLYNITVVNDYVLTMGIKIGVKIISISEINKAFYKSVELSKELIVFYLRPPPIN